MEIGIVGYGVVGKAVEYGFESLSDIYIYDPLYVDNEEDKFMSSIEEVMRKSRIVFVCVPTPMTEVAGGPFDSTVIDSVMKEVGEASAQWDLPPVVVIESAVIPSKIKQYIKDYPKIRLVVSPEYLTEKEPFDKFINPDCRILGGSPEDTSEVQSAFEVFSICKRCDVGYCDAIGAAVIKYMENSFLAMKVSFMNQFYDLLKESGSETEWNHLARIFHFDSRMGNSHYKIPGHDGDRGWGGKCLPKDINAIIYEAKKLGCDLTIMEEVWKYNLENREDINWAKIKGAVSEKE
jgi:UDPglucose 6-dehydrogenase